LSRLREEHLSTVLNMQRPPELVKRVFSALMILVSPFEPSHFDVSWFAVQHWIAELGNVNVFLENLRVFQIEMVPQANVDRTIAFMHQSGLSRDRLEPLSESLADLCDWIYLTCAPAVSQTTQQASSLEEEAAPLTEEKSLKQDESFEGSQKSPRSSPVPLLE